MAVDRTGQSCWVQLKVWVSIEVSQDFDCPIERTFVRFLRYRHAIYKAEITPLRLFSYPVYSHLNEKGLKMGETDTAPNTEGEDEEQDGQGEDGGDTTKPGEQGADGTDGADGDEGKPGDGKPADDKNKPPAGDDEPPIRPSRKAANAAAAQQRIANKQNRQDGKPNSEPGKGDEGADADAQFAQQFERVVGESVDDFKARKAEMAERENEAELDSFFSKDENARFKPDEAKIRTWWKHQSRNHLPIETVAYEVAGKRLLKLGADEGRKADEEAGQTRSGGSGARGSAGGGKSLIGMSITDREAEIVRVKQESREKE